MRVAYYTTPDRIAALEAEARSWLGTPFSENCAIKGQQGGVDCVRYLAACHHAAGACEAIDLPVRPVEHVRSWHLHNPSSLILDWLGRPELRGRVRSLDIEETPATGDIAVLKLSLTEHHVALLIGAELLHVAIPAGVVSHSAKDPELTACVRSWYRVYTT